MDSSVETSDGRVVSVTFGGAESGVPVVYFMGTPSSRLIFPLHDESARRHGVRLVSYDRPGYGGSTARPGRTVADSAEDVRAIADQLGLERFGLWGWSGGGPFVLGVAAGLAERVTGAVVLASPAPGLYELDPEEDYEAARAGMLAETPADWLGRLQPEFASFADFAIATLGMALADGAEGWREDDLAMAGDWGFELERVRVPVRIRHGRADKSVAVEHGERLGSRIPGAEVLIADDDNHQATHFRHLDDDFAWLAAQTSATA